MKKINLSLLFFLLIFPFVSQAQILTFSIQNMAVTGFAPDFALEFDIYVRSSVPGTYHVAGNIYLNYNTAAFGSFVSNNGNIVCPEPNNFTCPPLPCPPLELMNPPSQCVYNYYASDNSASILALNWFNLYFFDNTSPQSAPDDFKEVGTVDKPLMHVKLVYPDPNIPHGISFNTGLMHPSGGIPPFYYKPFANGLSQNYTGIAIDNSNLPVEWLDFTAERLDRSNIQLRWETSREVNNDYFSVQRSVDGRMFEEIGKVKGSGTTSNPTTYAFLDNNYQANVNYYRLKQVDLDGTFSYSKVVEVRFSEEDNYLAFYVYPSPASSRITAELTGRITEQYLFEVFDATGRRVISENVDRDKPKRSFDVSQLPQGIYNYQLIGNDRLIKAGRFLKH